MTTANKTITENETENNLQTTAIPVYWFRERNHCILTICELHKFWRIEYENGLAILTGQSHTIRSERPTERKREREKYRVNSSNNNCINTCTEWINGWLPFCFKPFAHVHFCAALHCSAAEFYSLRVQSTHAHIVLRLPFIVQFHIFIH